MPMFMALPDFMMGLSSPLAAKPCARLPQESCVRLIPASRPRLMRSRYLVRACALRFTIRSVTAAMVEFRSVMPTRSIPFDKSNGRGRTPVPRGIFYRLHISGGPAMMDAVDPGPCRLHFVGPHEPGWKIGRASCTERVVHVV